MVRCSNAKTTVLDYLQSAAKLLQKKIESALHANWDKCEWASHIVSWMLRFLWHIHKDIWYVICLMYTCGTFGCDCQCHEYVPMLRVDKLRFTKQHVTQILPKHAPTHSSLMWEFRILSQLSSVRSCLATCRKHGYSKYFQKCPEKLPNEDRLRRRREWEIET